MPCLSFAVCACVHMEEHLALAYNFREDPFLKEQALVLSCYEVYFVWETAEHSSRVMLVKNKQTKKQCCLRNEAHKAMP